MTRLIITLDGPAGSGKSTVARLLAQRLGLEFLDTGAMYRGVTAVCLDRGVDPTDADAVAAIAQSIQLRFNWQEDPPVLLIDGVPYVDRLRDDDVTAAVSDVAAVPAVRHVLVAQQQRIGKEHPRLVTEGRDQGSVVFPEAPLKLFIDATSQERARRRAAQLREQGREIDEKAILEQIERRDRRDAGRSVAPLVCPVDAAIVETSQMTLEQVVDHLAALALTRLGRTRLEDRR